jgi:hypothetical protein
MLVNKQNQLTDKQILLISDVMFFGFGYKIFAENVKKQGWCSQKQEAALVNMLEKATQRSSKWGGTVKNYRSKRYLSSGEVFPAGNMCGLSYDDAMSYGDY